MTAVQRQNQQIILQGRVTYDNAEQLYQQGLALLNTQTEWPVQINLSQLEHPNTLALAVVIQWLRHCPHHQCIQLVEVPVKMAGIIRASHLEQLLHTN